jgi:hypothetical protein
LHVPWGYVAALQCDPTEKKPFYHLLPGSDTLTFGMLGCWAVTCTAPIARTGSHHKLCVIPHLTSQEPICAK